MGNVLRKSRITCASETSKHRLSAESTDEHDLYQFITGVSDFEIKQRSDNWNIRNIPSRLSTSQQEDRDTEYVGFVRGFGFARVLAVSPRNTTRRCKPSKEAPGTVIKELIPFDEFLVRILCPEDCYLRVPTECFQLLNEIITSSLVGRSIDDARTVLTVYNSTNNRTYTKTRGELAKTPSGTSLLRLLNRVSSGDPDAQIGVISLPNPLDHDGSDGESNSGSRSDRSRSLELSE